MKNVKQINKKSCFAQNIQVEYFHLHRNYTIYFFIENSCELFCGKFLKIFLKTFPMLKFPSRSVIILLEIKGDLLW